MAYSVRISGTVLSSLLYECANSKTDIEGFFLGALSVRTTLTSDDSHEQPFESRQDYIIIHGYQILNEIPYDEQGQMIKTIIKSQQADISSLVGYFKFRRQTDISLSIRDQLWMKSYSDNVPHGCIAIISSNLSAFRDKSTHTYEFAFWDMKNTLFKLHLEIINMANDTLSFNSFMSNAPFKSTPSSNSLQLSHIPSSETIVTQYDSMFNQAMQSLKDATDTVIKKEQELQKLKKEIERLEI